MGAIKAMSPWDEARRPNQPALKKCPSTDGIQTQHWHLMRPAIQWKNHINNERLKNKKEDRQKGMRDGWQQPPWLSRTWIWEQAQETVEDPEGPGVLRSLGSQLLMWLQAGKTTTEQRQYPPPPPHWLITHSFYLWAFRKTWSKWQHRASLDPPTTAVTLGGSVLHPACFSLPVLFGSK